MLLSEQTAYELTKAMDFTEFRNSVNTFEECVNTMKRVVTVLAEIKAMDQANMLREMQGYGPAYGEDACRKVNYDRL